MKRAAARQVILFLAMTVGTVALGWWSVPALAAAWGLVRHRDRRVGPPAALAAGLSWTALLLWRALDGPARGAAAMLGDIFGTPGLVPIILTILFPALLAGSAAAFMSRAARIRQVTGLSTGTGGATAADGTRNFNS